MDGPGSQSIKKDEVARITLPSGEDMTVRNKAHGIHVTIGDKEVEKKTLAVRNREGKTKFDVKVDKFVDDLLEEIREKKV